MKSLIHLKILCTSFLLQNYHRCPVRGRGDWNYHRGRYGSLTHKIERLVKSALVSWNLFTIKTLCTHIQHHR